ncbi:MAG: hypothetical protein ABF310_06635 [Paracoccaceae bacterium]
MMDMMPYVMPLVAMLTLMACDPRAAQIMPTAQEAQAAQYKGVQTRLLDQDLINLRVRMSDVTSRYELTEYADCAAAQYTLIRGYLFAQHVRTNFSRQNGDWLADSVYVIRPNLPDGPKKLDAEVVVAACTDNAIPTV